MFRVSIFMYKTHESKFIDFYVSSSAELDLRILNMFENAVVSMKSRVL